jgi:hypothetical protein
VTARSVAKVFEHSRRSADYRLVVIDKQKHGVIGSSLPGPHYERFFLILTILREIFRPVCRRTNKYFVVFPWTSTSSLLLQALRSEIAYRNRFRTGQGDIVPPYSGAPFIPLCACRVRPGFPLLPVSLYVLIPQRAATPLFGLFLSSRSLQAMFQLEK